MIKNRGIWNRTTFSTKTWSEIIQESRNRKTFNGLKFKANFGDFPPYCFCQSRDSVRGALLDTITEVCKVLNLTLTIKTPEEQNWNVWANKFPNGSWTGMIREIIDERVDTSIAGENDFRSTDSTKINRPEHNIRMY